MNRYPQLNFPSYRFRLRMCEGKNRIWDDIRMMWLVLTPEEWVRRHVVRWLALEHGITPQMIVQECPVDVHGQPQRADVVVFGRDARPLLLVECKEPNIEISQEVYAQAVRYNAVLGAVCIMITNGFDHYLYERNADGGYSPTNIFPDVR